MHLVQSFQHLIIIQIIQKCIIDGIIVPIIDLCNWILCQLLCLKINIIINNN